MSDIVSSVGYCGQPVAFLTKETASFGFVSGNGLVIYNESSPREMLWQDNGISCYTAHMGSGLIATAPALAQGEVQVRSFDTELIQHSFANPLDTEVIALEFSRDGTKLYALSATHVMCFLLSDDKLAFSEKLPSGSGSSLKSLSVSPGNENNVCLFGDEGLGVVVVTELDGVYSVRVEITSISTDLEEDADNWLADVARSNAITFVRWLPFDYLVVGNRSGNLIEAHFDGRTINVLRKQQLGNMPGAGPGTYATQALVGLNTLVVGTNTGRVHWLQMCSFGMAPGLESTLVFTDIAQQTSSVGGFVSSMAVDAAFTKIVVGTRAAALKTLPMEVQERVVDADMDMDMAEELQESLDPIVVEPSVITQFQQGAVVCAKSMQIPYDNKNAISVYVTASHTGGFHIWRQPFVEAEAIASNTGVRRSIPRPCVQLYSAQAGFEGQDTVITSLEVLPYRGKGGTTVIALGTDVGFIEYWEVSAVLSEEDEEEGGDDAVRVSARCVARRRLYTGAVDVSAATSFPSTTSIVNLLAVASSASDLVHCVEANNTGTGFGFEVRCTFKVPVGTVTGCDFDGSSLYVTASDGQVHQFGTSAYACGGPLAYPAPDASFTLSAGDVSGSLLLRNAAAATFVGISDASTQLVSVEMSSLEEKAILAPHDSLVVSFAASGNGRFVVTGCVDGSTYLWEKEELNRFKLVNRLFLHSDAVTSVCFSPDSTLVLSCGVDGSLFLSTACEGKLGKQDTRPMKINDRVAVDTEFTAMVDGPDCAPWLVAKEEQAFQTLKLEHEHDTEDILGSLAKLAEKHRKLIAENDSRTELEQMEHSEFVVDIKSRAALEQGNELAAQEKHAAFQQLNSWNELTAARVRGDCWDSMDQQSRPLMPLINPENTTLTQYSMSVRKYSAAETDRLDKVRRLRCLEVRAQQADGGMQSKLPGGKMRVAWSTEVKGCPEVTSWIAMDGARWPCEDVIQMLKDKAEQEEREAAEAKKAPRTEDDDDEEEDQVAIPDDDDDAEEDEAASALDESDIFNLLYPPQACRTQVQKRTQITLLKEVSRLVCSKFNDHFDKVAAEKDDVIGSVEGRNARIRVILSELQQMEEQFQPAWKILELPNSAVTVFDSELDAPVYESAADRQKRLDAEEEARRREAEKDADNIQGRALQDMMNGVLSVKKDMLSDDALIRPAWMDELDPKDMTELQLKELDEFDEKCRLIAEEQVRYKKALELELKGLKQANTDSVKAFDEKLAELAKVKVLVQKELLSHELYVSRLALSMAKRDQAWAQLKRNESTIATTKVQRNTVRSRMDAFNGTVEGVKALLNAAQEEERNMDKGFNRNLQDLTGTTLDVESLKVFKNLFKKRTYPTNGEEDEFAEESVDNAGAGKSSKASKVSKGPKRSSKTSSKAVPSGSKVATGSKVGKENLGPMQEAAKALGAEDTVSQVNEDVNDPFYFALVAKDKAIKAQELEVPLLDQLSIEADCPDSFSVDQFTWSKLQELRTARVEKDIEAKKLGFQMGELQAKMEVLACEDQDLTARIRDLRDQNIGLAGEIKFLESSLDVVVCLKQGNDEIDKDAVVSDFSDGLMLPVSVVEKFNTKIKEHGKEKISVLTKIKQFRRKINIIDWNAQHLTMQSHHFEEYFTDLQLLRVTRDLQQVIRDGSDESQTKQRLEKIAQRKDFLQKNADVKIGKLRKFNDGMKKNLKDKTNELETLQFTIQDLRSDLAQRKSVQASRNDARGTTGDNQATASIKMKKVVQRRQLVDTARSQAEEIDYLRQELDKMRQRTFPSFAKLKKKSHK